MQHICSNKYISTYIPALTKTLANVLACFLVLKLMKHYLSGVMLSWIIISSFWLKLLTQRECKEILMMKASFELWVQNLKVYFFTRYLYTRLIWNNWDTKKSHRKMECHSHYHITYFIPFQIKINRFHWPLDLKIVS